MLGQDIAMKKTARIVTESNQHRLSDEELREWQDAIEEYLTVVEKEIPDRNPRVNEPDRHASLFALALILRTSPEFIGLARRTVGNSLPPEPWRCSISSAGITAPAIRHCYFYSSNPLHLLLASVRFGNTR
jgi:hypothetical protein